MDAYRNDMLLVPLWIAIVNQSSEREEQVERKLEYFKIRTSHLPLSVYWDCLLLFRMAGTKSETWILSYSTMVGGPLGITLAPYIYRRPALLKVLTPFAQAYINWSGYRKIGLRYDDLRKHVSRTLL